MYVHKLRFERPVIPRLDPPIKQVLDCQVKPDNDKKRRYGQTLITLFHTNGGLAAIQ